MVVVVVVVCFGFLLLFLQLALTLITNGMTSTINYSTEILGEIEP